VSLLNPARTTPILLGLLLPAAALASEPAVVGPQPDHTVLRPQGRHKRAQDVATVPGPTADCVAKAQVFVPWSICRSMGSRPEQGPRRFEAYAQADPPLPQGTSCAFVCTPAAGLASWSFLVPVPGYRGTLTCPVSRSLTLTLRVAGSDAEPSKGATIQWQTDLGETVYTLSDPSLMEGRPQDLERMIFEAQRRLDGPNACPAGQPQRTPE